MADHIVDAALEALRISGFAYVRGLGDEKALLSFAGQLGEIVPPGVGMPSGAHDDRVYSVRVRDGGAGFRDRHGNLVLSSTNLAFPLHTDAYNRDRPPRYVLLLRSDESADATPTYVSDARAALRVLPTHLSTVLREPVLPSALGPVPLVESRDGVSDWVRFNREEIDHWEERNGNPSLAPPAREALSQFAKATRERQQPIVIRTPDCLAIDTRAWFMDAQRCRLLASAS
jgi:hypothetical protein